MNPLVFFFSKFFFPFSRVFEKQEQVAYQLLQVESTRESEDLFFFVCVCEFTKEVSCV